MRGIFVNISTTTSVFVNYALEEAIHHTAEAGYDGIDIWGGRPHVYRHDFGAQELCRIRDLIAQAHLTVPSFMPAFFRYPHSLVSPNETVRQDSLQYMYECADNAAALGAQSLLVIPGRSLSNQSPHDAWSRLLDSVAEVCRYTAQYDLMLAVEPANVSVSDLLNTAADAMRLIEAVGDDRLGVALDTGHIHLSSESPAQAVEACGTRLLQVHVNDNDGKSQQNLILGEGSFDFAGFIQLLQAHHYQGYLTTELGWSYTLEPVPAVREMARIMRAALE